MLMSRLKRLQPGNRVRRVYQFRGLEFRLVAQGHLGTGSFGRLYLNQPERPDKKRPGKYGTSRFAGSFLYAEYPV